MSSALCREQTPGHLRLEVLGGDKLNQKQDSTEIWKTVLARRYEQRSNQTELSKSGIRYCYNPVDLSEYSVFFTTHKRKGEKEAEPKEVYFLLHGLKQSLAIVN